MLFLAAWRKIIGILVEGFLIRGLRLFGGGLVVAGCIISYMLHSKIGA